MAASPPKRLERIVEILLPPSCREEVIGDLHERYSSPGQYIAEALKVLVLMNFSRIRRTTDSQLLLTQALLTYGAHLSSAWYLGGLDNLTRLAIPTAVALFVLPIHDAWVPRRPVIGAAVAATVASLTGIDLPGCVLGFLLVTTIRISLPSFGPPPSA